jgi:phage-related protein
MAREETPVTADTPLRLGRYFATGPEFWMNLQTTFDLASADHKGVTHPAKGGVMACLLALLSPTGRPYLSSLDDVVKYDNKPTWSLSTRPISCLKPALRDFQSFPAAAQARLLDALTAASAGGKADIAKPLKGFGSGVVEIALKHKGDAFRVVYALQLGPDLIVVHAFQKKSKRCIETPKAELDVVHEQLKRLKAGQS